MAIEREQQAEAQTAALKRFAWLSIGAALATIGLKGGAYVITDSVGLLSDALESLVNLVAAVVALLALSVAARPADEEHAYGHTKAEYFSSGFEGALILVASVATLVAAALRLVEPRAVQEVGLGLAISAAASVINFVVARTLIRAGRRYGSISLEADAHHLMTDVWTSVGVIAAVGGAALTDFYLLDPLVAIAVGLHIGWVGVVLLRRSMLGLLDTALPEQARQEIVDLLESYAAGEVQYHALRTRRAGRRRFVSFHVLVPGEWSVQRGHDLLEEIEERVRALLPNTTVFTHLEPIEDPISWADTHLERRPPPTER